MLKITVNGVSLAYEIVGGEGPSIALTPAGPGPGGIAMVKERNKLLGEKLSKLGFKILIWDRRNSGESDVSIEGEPSEWELFADDLHSLLNELGMVPTYASGGSGGYLVSLILAHRHPEDVKGLPLRAPMTGDLEVWNRLANNRYLQPAEEAENNGMKAVIENTIWEKVVEQNIASHEKLLSLDPKEFTAVMKRWSEWNLSGKGHVGGLSDEELRQITTPAIFIPDAVQNDAHPRNTAEKLQKLLPHSESALSEDVFSSAEIDKMHQWWKDKEMALYSAAYAAPIHDFIQRR